MTFQENSGTARRVHISPNTMTWFEAQTYCHDLGMLHSTTTGRLVKGDRELVIESGFDVSQTYWTQLSALKLVTSGHDGVCCIRYSDKHYFYNLFHLQIHSMACNGTVDNR